MKPASSSLARVLHFICVGLVATAVWIQGGALRAQGIDPNNVVGYSPPIQSLQGEPGVNFPQTYKLKITAPKNMTATTTVNLVVTGGSTDVAFYSQPPIGGLDVGPINIGGIPNVLSQVTQLTFHPPVVSGGAPESIDVWVSLNLLAGVDPGLHVYQFKATGWFPAATNPGASINATATYPDQKLPPTVTITSLKQGTTVLNPDGSAANNTVTAPIGSVVDLDVVFTAVSGGSLAQQSDVTVDGLLDGSSIGLSLTGTNRNVTAAGVLHAPAVSLAGTVYSFVAKGTNEGGNGSDTATFTVVASPTISVANTTVTYDGTRKPATVTANPADLDYAVTYVGTGGTSYGPTQVAPTLPGTYSATAAFTNPAYTATGTGTITINKAPLTIKADNQSRIYGGALLPFSASYSGFVSGDDASVVSGLVLSSSVTATSGVGSYDIVPSGATAANYAITFTKGTHTVNPASLTIAANSATKVYGVTPLTPTVSYSGFVNGDTSGVVSGLVVTSGVTANTDVGSYAIVPAGATAANYTINFTPGTLQVTPAALTVTAVDKSSIYGNALPTFTASYSGLVAGDTGAVVTGLSFTTTASASSSVGTYPIQVTGGSAGNYTLTRNNGTLTINQAYQKLKLSPAPANSVAVGAAPFNLNAISETNSAIASPNPITYSSSNGAVATVDATGKVTVLAIGSTTITLNQAGSTNYTAAAPLTFSLVVGAAKVTPTIVWANPADVVVGTALSGTQLNATANYNGEPVAGTFAYTPASGTVMTSVGSVTLSTTFTPTDTTRYNSATATVTLNVVGPSMHGIALVRHGLTLNGWGAIDGSIQVLLPETDTLNGNAYITGNLYVAGKPDIVATGHPIYTVVDGLGAASPTKHTVTMHGNALIGAIVRRTDAVQMPTVDAPPAPTGTRNVTLNSPTDNPGSFTTIKNLTANGNVGTVVVPPGTYGTFTANGQSNLQLGVAGSATPTVYNFQSLNLNGQSNIVVVGPVVITLAKGVAFNGNVGNAANPAWVVMRLASGDFTLNGNVSFNGFVIAPNGTITINGNDVLKGNIACDKLVINGQGLLDVVE